MNDPRIEQLFTRLRAELMGLTDEKSVEERLQETRTHFEDAIEEFTKLGAADPVGAALQAFGTVEAYHESVNNAGDGILLRQPSKEVLCWVAAILLVPIGADLAMDFSSWITGHDSSMFALGIPACAFMLWKLGVASTRSRRFLWMPISTIVALSFIGFIALGGFSKGTNAEFGLQPRGTSARRMQSLEALSVPRKLQTKAALQRGIDVFAHESPTMGIGEFRVAQGYLAPTIPNNMRNMWMGAPDAARYMIDSVRLQPAEIYAEAHAAWKANGPKFLTYAENGLQGDKNEIAQLDKVVHSSWAVSVKTDLTQKTTMAVIAWMGLLFVHAIGMGVGVVNRKYGPKVRRA